MTAPNTTDAAPAFKAETTFKAEVAAKLRTPVPAVVVPPVVPPAAAAVVEPPPPNPTEPPASADSVPASVGDSTEPDDDDLQDDENAPDEDLAPDFLDTMSRAGAKISLEDIPETARPLVKQRLLEVQRGLTRLRQQDTEYRTELQELRADKLFNDAQGPAAIALRYTNDPTFKTAIDAILDRLTGEGGAAETKLLQRDLETERATARTKVNDQHEAQQAAATLATRVDSKVRKFAADAGIPQRSGVPLPRGLELMVSDLLDEHDNAPAKITDALIKRVVGDYAKEVRGHRRQVARDESAAGVKARLDAAKRATPVVPPGVGTAPAPAAIAIPKTEKEYKAQVAERLRAQRPT